MYKNMNLSVLKDKMEIIEFTAYLFIDIHKVC